ncbi:hypothetical protein [Nocardioides litoris]|uniref:hypothetical protein n=1 Tax=Nocardioides litoris TaxID=1926648 RepID=UPI001121D0FA|nr:hypothetical protein [Nocardioides litoris]
MPDRPSVTSYDDAPHPDEVRERPLALRVLRRLRGPIVLVPLLAALLVAAGVGAGKLFEEVPERATPDREVTCWDGVVRPTGACPEPAGRAGLKWVFPALRPTEQGCTQVRRPNRPLELRCTTSFDQRPVTLTYAVLASTESGHAFLTKRWGEPTEDADGDRLVWSPEEPVEGDDGDPAQWTTTVGYAEHPFAVTVTSTDRDVRDEALDELVRFRDAADVRYVS